MFGDKEEKYLKMFLENNSDFAIRLTPKYKLSDSQLENKLEKINSRLLDKGYNIRGYIVKDIGEMGFHYHSVVNIGDGDKGEFKNLFQNIVNRFGFKSYCEEIYDEGKYELYMVHKLFNWNYWIGLWG